MWSRLTGMYDLLFTTIKRNSERQIDYDGEKITALKV